MKMKDFGALVLLASMWGSSFLFMRIAGPAIGPLLTTELRVLLAAIALLVYAALMKYKPQILRQWKQFLLLGTINAALPFALICTAEMHITASLAAILNATTPLFTALVAWGWIKDPMNGKKLTGVLLGILGVGILVGWSPVTMEWNVLYSIGFSLLAALCYAFAGIYASRTFKGVKPLDLAIGQQLGASIVLLPFALLSLPDTMPPASVVYSILVLAVVCTAVAYLIYFYLIHNVGPVKALSVTFLVPVFGVIWGVVFLGESVYVNTVVGLVVIFMSIVLVMNLLPKRGKKEVERRA